MIKTTVGALVCVILAASLLVPAIDDARDGEEVMEVIVLAGQSNAAYPLNTPRISVEEVRETVPLPPTGCFYYGTDARPVYHSTDLDVCGFRSMVRNGEWQIGSEEAPMAYEISTATNSDVMIINVAVPGQPIANFLPGTQYGDRIAEIVEKAVALIPSEYTIHRAGWVWIQGEADPETPVAEYIEDFHTIQSMFTAHGFKTCYLVETRDSGLAHEAHQDLIATDPDVRLGSNAPAGFSVADGTLVEGNAIHYTQKGRTIVGEDVGEAISKGLPVMIRDIPGSSILGVIPVLVILAVVVGVASVAVRAKTN